MLRWLRERESRVHGLLAGFLAGSSMMFWKSTTVAMYLTSKMIEVACVGVCECQPMAPG